MVANPLAKVHSESSMAIASAVVPTPTSAESKSPQQSFGCDDGSDGEFWCQEYDTKKEALHAAEEKVQMCRYQMVNKTDNNTQLPDNEIDQIEETLRKYRIQLLTICNFTKIGEDNQTNTKVKDWFGKPVDYAWLAQCADVKF